MSLGECKLTCGREGGATLLPVPRDFDLGNFVVPVNPKDIEFTNSEQLLATGVSLKLSAAYRVF